MPNEPTPVWSAPLLRAQKMQMLAGQLVGTSLRNEVGTATLLPMSLDASLWQELLDIQHAILERVAQQQQNWWDGCKDVYAEYSQLKMANTLSKFVEQEYNVVAQFNALVANQAASWAGLMENIHVDYAYWLTQKHAQVADGAGGGHGAAQATLSLPALPGTASATTSQVVPKAKASAKAAKKVTA